MTMVYLSYMLDILFDKLRWISHTNKILERELVLEKFVEVWRDDGVWMKFGMNYLPVW